MNADVFIEFLKRLLVGRTAHDFPDRRSRPGAHRAKKTKAFVETLGGRLKLFFLPPYSPDRNPDELVWKHLKADTVGRMVVTVKPTSKARWSPPCAACKRTRGRFAPSSKSRRFDMPLECDLTYGLINIHLPFLDQFCVNTTQAGRARHWKRWLRVRLLARFVSGWVSACHSHPPE